MNKQLQQAISSVIDKSITAFEAGATFLSEQIPDVVNQLLLWEAVSSLVNFLLILATSCLITYLNYKQFKYWTTTVTVNGYYGQRTEMRISQEYGGIALVNIFQIPLIFFLASHVNLIWLKIYLAPKLFLIEYAANLIKG